MCLFLIRSPSIPPLGFDKNITTKFKNYCIDNKCQYRPTAPTCPLDFTLPVHFSSSEGFTSKFSDTVRECQGFRNIQFSAGLENPVLDLYLIILKSTTIVLRKHFLLPVMIFHFRKCTCNNISNAKQYESLSASILFFFRDCYP